MRSDYDPHWRWPSLLSLESVPSVAQDDAMVSLLEWKPSSKDHDWDGTAVRIPDTLSAFVTFKYRVWFTWYMMQIFLPETGESVSQRREEFWLAAVSGANENFDLWFWDDDDEGYIKGFIEDHRLNLYLEMSMVDWVNACRALEGRRRPSDSVLSQLTPSTRLRFIAWLIVAEVGRKQHLRQNGNIGELHDLIAWWGMSIAYLEVERCEICGVSHLLKLLRQDKTGGPTYILKEIQPHFTFLDIVRGPDEDLFAWDDVDDTIFYQALVKERELGLFPQDWNQYMVQIDIRTWLQIKNTTWTVYRPHTNLKPVDSPRRRLSQILLLVKHPPKYPFPIRSQP
ncbi:hypothetical protein B0H13DRAFT_2279376 [Mycena leptocephala]|nr:hypothetical protein B0H13DRAFT_2279376 [Mycena leptocephala]